MKATCQPAALFDDTCSYVNTLLQAAQIIEAAGRPVSLIAVILDREEDGGSALLREKGYPFISLLTSRRTAGKLPPAAGHRRGARPAPGAFRALVDQWLAETKYHSVIQTDHPADQEIVGMGAEAIPLLLRELQEHGSHWFAALHVIGGENPIPPEHPGRLSEMTEGRLEWGRQRSYWP